MIWRAVSIALLVLAVVGTTGCETAELIEDVKTPYTVPNVANEATDAWRDENDNLIVCVNGWHAKRSSSTDPEPFSFSMKAGSMDVSPEEAGQIPVILVPVEQIEEVCPERPSGAGAIEIERIRAETGDEADLPVMPRERLVARLDLEREGPVLYSIDGSDAEYPATLLYLHEVSFPGGSRLVRINLSRQEMKRSKARLLLLPVTIVVDVVVHPLACIGSIYRGAAGGNDC